MSDSILVYSTDVGRIKEEKASVVRPKETVLYVFKNKRVVGKVQAYRL